MIKLGTTPSDCQSVKKPAIFHPEAEAGSATGFIRESGPDLANAPTGDCVPHMATISKSKKSVRKSVRLVRAAKPVKVLPYGITARALPAGVAKAGDNAATAYEFGKNADWAAVAAAYESRSL